MVDSGSGIDGVNAGDVAPGVPLVQSVDRIICSTASGEQMLADKEALCSVELDGQPVDIAFRDLPLTMPILSMRRRIHRGHSCRIRDGGGYFRNLATRKKTRFVEKDCVYFVRMKIKGPSTIESTSVSSNERPSGVARHGAA